MFKKMFARFLLHFSDQVDILLKYITLVKMFIMKLIKRYLIIYASLVSNRRYSRKAT